MLKTIESQFVFVYGKFDSLYNLISSFNELHPTTEIDLLCKKLDKPSKYSDDTVFDDDDNQNQLIGTAESDNQNQLIGTAESDNQNQLIGTAESDNQNQLIETVKEEISRLINKNITHDGLVNIFMDAINSYKRNECDFSEMLRSINENIFIDFQDSIDFTNYDNFGVVIDKYKRNECDDNELIKEIQIIIISEDLIAKNQNEYFEKAGDCLEQINEVQNSLNMLAVFNTDNQKLEGGDLILSTDCDFDDKNFSRRKFLIDGITGLCRRWYKKDDTILRAFFNYYYVDRKEMAIKIDFKRKDGGIADIYPAEKFALFLIYLCFYEGKEIKEGEENKRTVIENAPKKIAAYVLFVFLFNTWCACIMESGWNSSLSNEYVYKKIINGQKHKVKMTIDENSFKARLNVDDNEDVHYKMSLIMDHDNAFKMTEIYLNRIRNSPNTTPEEREKLNLPPINTNDGTQVDIQLADDMLNETPLPQPATQNMHVVEMTDIEYQQYQEYLKSLQNQH